MYSSAEHSTPTLPSSLTCAQENFKELIEKFTLPSSGLRRLDHLDEFEFSLIICLYTVRSHPLILFLSTLNEGP